VSRRPTRELLRARRHAGQSGQGAFPSGKPLARRKGAQARPRSNPGQHTDRSCSRPGDVEGCPFHLRYGSICARPERGAVGQLWGTDRAGRLPPRWEAEAQSAVAATSRGRPLSTNSNLTGPLCHRYPGARPWQGSKRI